MRVQHVLQNTAPTVSFTFQVDGENTDPTPDTATVDIVRADGTEVVSAASAVPGPDGLFSYQLSTAQTALLDRLTVSWTSNLGTIPTTVEVAGGFVCGLAELRATNPLNDEARYPTSKLVAMRTLVERRLERVCNRAFVPRYERQRISGSCGWRRSHLATQWANVRSVRDLTVNGQAYDAPALALAVPEGNMFYLPTGWGLAGVPSDITIGYEHGDDFPEPAATQAALLLAKLWLVEGPADDRATSMSTADGTFALVTPGMRGARFSLPEVNEIVAELRIPIPV